MAEASQAEEVNEDEELPSETFAQAMLGKSFFLEGIGQKLMAYPASYRIAGAAAAFAAFLFIPYLGAVGLWDPWETHYGEVARMMIQRGDYVYPWWESAWFFSKPPLTMWIQALGMQLVGANWTEGPLALYTEWGMRLPFALLSITSLSILAVAISRIASRRAALATVFVLATMPLYFLLTRQAVTDTPFVCSVICAMACALIGQFDNQTPHRAAWWYAFYVFCGLGMLAKGLLGPGLPVVVLILYALLCVLPKDAQGWDNHLRWLLEGEFRARVRAGDEDMPVLWAQFFNMRLGTGILVWGAVCLPWFITLFLFPEVDDEGKLFWYRFLIHDHFNRLGAGVHTTTPGGTFTYFIEQGGFAIFPWVALVPGALIAASRARLGSRDKADHLTIIAALWTGVTFALIGMSATKFHHYVFPVLPGLAVLIGLFIDKLWEEGVGKHAVVLLVGGVLFMLVGKDLASNTKNFTDLFVYNYDRPYPTELVTQPLRLSGGQALWMGHLLVISFLGIGAYLLYEAFTTPRASAHAKGVAAIFGIVGLSFLVTVLNGGKSSPLPYVGGGLLVVAFYLGMEASRPELERENRGPLVLTGILTGAAGALCLLLAYVTRANAEVIGRTLVMPVNIKQCLGFYFILGGGLSFLAVLSRSRVRLFTTFGAFTLAFALWFNWDHWVDLSHHWTQRDQFWRYFKYKNGDEPITAFLMNWRGETFYSKNTVKQIKENPRLTQYANLPGRKFALVEHPRLGILQGAVGDKKITLIDKELNNKFVLVTIE